MREDRVSRVPEATREEEAACPPRGETGGALVRPVDGEARAQSEHRGDQRELGPEGEPRRESAHTDARRRQRTQGNHGDRGEKQREAREVASRRPTRRVDENGR